MTRIMDHYGDFTFHAFHSMHFKISEQVSLLYGIKHGVQRRMISVDNCFGFLRLLFFAVLLLYVT